MLALLPLLVLTAAADPAPAAAPHAAPPEATPAPAAPAPAAEERPLVAVLNLEANTGAKEQAPGVTAMVASRLAEGRGVRVITQADISTALGLERERQLLAGGACASSECLVELSGAVGARFVVSGRLDRFGTGYVLTATLFDSQRALSLAKPRAEAPDEARLPEAAEALSRALLAAPELGASGAVEDAELVGDAGRFSLGLRIGSGFLANLASFTPSGDLELGYQLTREWAPFLQVGFSLVRQENSGISLLPSALGVRRFYRVEEALQPYWGLGLGLQLSFGTYGLFQQTGPLPTVLGLGGVRWRVLPRLGLQLEASTNLAQTVLGIAREQQGNGLNLELTGGVAYTF